MVLRWIETKVESKIACSRYQESVEIHFFGMFSPFFQTCRLKDWPSVRFGGHGRNGIGALKFSDW